MGKFVSSDLIRLISTCYIDSNFFPEILHKQQQRKRKCISFVWWEENTLEFPGVNVEVEACQMRCSVICSVEMSKLISSEDIRENGTPWQLVSPLTGTRRGSMTWLWTCCSTNSYSPLWFSSNPSTSKPLISSSWWPFCDSAAFVTLSLFCSDESLTESDLMFQTSAKSPDLKKAGKAPHAQGSLKEVSLPANSSNTWNRPRCGVPDYPAQKEVHYRVRNRQRRFVLYGGRLDRTDLTYRYRKCSRDYIFLAIMWIHHSCTHWD